MKRFALIILSLVLLVSLCNCMDYEKQASGTSTTKRTTERETSATEHRTEEATSTADSNRLICAVWEVTSETKGGKTRDVENGDVLSFDQSGKLYDEDGYQIGTWLLQGDLLTTYTDGGIKNYKISEITGTTFSLHQTGGSDYSMTLTCIRKNNYREGAYIFSKATIEGVWSETGNTQKENALKIYSDGNLEMYYDGNLTTKAQWSLLQGNRLSLTIGGERQIWIISHADESSIEVSGIRFYRVG